MARVAQSSSVQRIANKAQLAAFFDVSLPTIDAWIRKGAPVMQRGSQGVSWQIDIRAMAEWVYSAGPDAAGDVCPENLHPTDRRAWYQSENERLRYEKELGDLIPVADVERSVSTAFASIAQKIRGVPDELERRHGLSGEVVEKVESALLDAMDDLATRLSELVPVEE